MESKNDFQNALNSYLAEDEDSSDVGTSYEGNVYNNATTDQETFDTALEEYLQPTSFETALAEYYTPAEVEDPYQPRTHASEVTAQSYIQRLFDSDESPEAQAVYAYISGYGLDSFSDETALKASEWAKQKAQELDDFKQPEYEGTGHFDKTLQNLEGEGFGERSKFPEQTRVELKGMFEMASKNFKMDPEYVDAYEKEAAKYYSMAIDAWNQFDAHKEDPENVEFPELHKAGVGEAYGIIPQGILSGFKDNLVNAGIQKVAELMPMASPVMRGTDEVNELSSLDKRNRAQYASYIPMYDYLAGIQRPPGQGDPGWDETVARTAGMILQFVAVPFKGGKAYLPEALAWEAGKRGMQGVMSKLGVRQLSTQRFTPRFTLKDPVKEMGKRFSNRAMQVGAGATGYSLARMEKGLVGPERVDENYLVDSFVKEAKMLAIEVPVAVAFGEVIHQGAKAVRPLFYKANAEMASNFGTPEKFQQAFLKINERASRGVADDSEKFFMQTVASTARDLGVPLEAIAVGQKGFIMKALSPRKWTEILPALRQRLSNRYLVMSKAKPPVQPKKAPKDAEAEVRDPQPKPTEMERLATQTGDDISAMNKPQAPPQKPIDKVDDGFNFVSGLERSPADATSAIAGGGQIGVRINQNLSKPTIDKIVDLTKLGQNIFIEHGLYKSGEMKEAEGDSFYDLTMRLRELYERGADPTKLYVVLPDSLDSALRTSELATEAYFQFSGRLPHEDINFIYPMQRMGAGGSFTSESTPLFNDSFSNENITIGIPANFSRVDPAELRSLFQKGILSDFKKFHLLGVDPSSQRGIDLIKVIREESPDAIVSADTALGRTSVNAVAKENMKRAADDLGLNEGIEEHPDWTDWVSEIWGTQPVTQGWTEKQMGVVSQEVTYGEKEATEVFNLFKENKSLEEIEDILGISLADDMHGGINKQAFRRILETIYPKTTRGDWIQEQVAKASEPQAPVAPPEEPTEPESEPPPPEEPTEPEAPPKEPEAETPPAEPEDPEDIDGGSREAPMHYTEVTYNNLDKATPLQLYDALRLANIQHEAGNYELEDYGFPMYYDIEKEIDRRVDSEESLDEFVKEIGWDNSPDAEYKDFFDGDEFTYENAKKQLMRIPSGRGPGTQFIKQFRQNLGTNIILLEKVENGIDWLQGWRKKHPRKKAGWKSLVWTEKNKVGGGESIHMLSEKIYVPENFSSNHGEKIRKAMNSKTGATYEMFMDVHLEVYERITGKPYPRDEQRIVDVYKDPETGKEQDVVLTSKSIQGIASKAYYEFRKLLAERKTSPSPIDDLLDLVDGDHPDTNSIVREHILQSLQRFKEGVESYPTTANKLEFFLEDVEKGVPDPKSKNAGYGDSDKFKPYPAVQLKEIVENVSTGKANHAYGIKGLFYGTKSADEYRRRFSLVGKMALKAEEYRGAYGKKEEEPYLGDKRENHEPLIKEVEKYLSYKNNIAKKHKVPLKEAYERIEDGKVWAVELQGQLDIYKQHYQAEKEQAHGMPKDPDLGSSERARKGNPLDEAFQRAQAKVKAESRNIKSSEKLDAIKTKAARNYITEKLDEAIKEAPTDPYTKLETKDLDDLTNLKKDASSGINKRPNDRTAEDRIALEKYLSFLNELIATNKLPYIELNVPYDGVFRIVNSKDTLKEFQKKIGKGASKIKASHTASISGRKFTTAPTSLPKKAFSPVDAGALFTARGKLKDDRPMLTNVVKMFNTIVATDGRRIIFISGDLSTKGKKVIELGGDRKLPDGTTYPNVEAVIPKEVGDGRTFMGLNPQFSEPMEMNQVHVNDLFEWVKATNIKPDHIDDSHRKVVFHRGTDGMLAVRYSSEGLSYATSNHNKNELDYFGIQPKHLKDLHETARYLECDYVQFQLASEKNHLSPVIVTFRGGKLGFPKAWALQMQIRADDPDHTTSGYAVEEGFQEPTLPQLARQFIRRHNVRKAIEAVYGQKEPLHSSARKTLEDAKKYKWIDYEVGLTTEEMDDLLEAYILGLYEEHGILNPLPEGAVRHEWVKMRNLMIQSYVSMRQKQTDAEIRSLVEAERLRENARQTDNGILAGGLISKLSDPNAHALEGKKLDPTKIEDFIAEAQVLRNPNFEYGHFVGIINGKIEKIFTHTYRNVGMAPIGPYNTNAMNDAWMVDQSKKFDQVVFVHNHPSGNPAPSVEDVRFTKHASKLMPNFAGHLIIDHGEYAFIDGTGKGTLNARSSIVTQLDLLSVPNKDDGIIGQLFQPETAGIIIDNYMMRLNGTKPGNAMEAGYFGFYLDKDYRVKGVARHLIKNGMSKNEILSEFQSTGKSLGAWNTIIYEPSAVNASEAEKQRVISDSINELMLGGEDKAGVLQFIRGGSEWIEPSDVQALSDKKIKETTTNIQPIQVMEPQDKAYNKNVNELGASSSEPVQSVFEYVDKNGNVVKQEFNLEAIPPIKFPEMVKFYESLKGEAVQLRKLGRSTLGHLMPDPADWHVALNRDVFKMPKDQAIKTLMHEIGHLIDFLDDMPNNINRGNILGRMASKRDYKEKSLPAFMGMPVKNFTMDPKERRKIRSNADKQIKEEMLNEWLAIAKNAGLAEEQIYKNPKRQSGFMEMYAEYLALEEANGVKMNAQRTKHEGKLQEEHKQRSKQRYMKMLTDRFAEGGMISQSALHAELIDLMDWWKPIGKNASKSFKAYRQSSVELYADAMSVLFNAPNELQVRAPLFWQSFFAYLDTKPSLSKKLRKLWEFTSNQKPVGIIRKRLERQRKQFKSIEHQVIQEDIDRRLPYKPNIGWWRTMQINHYDYAYGVTSRARKAKQEQGAKYDWSEDPEALWDMHPFSNNEPFLYTDKIQKSIVTPLQTHGLTIEDFGQYLFNTRILNEKKGRSLMANPNGTTKHDAKQNLLVMASDLGSGKMKLLEGYGKKFRDMFFDIYSDLYEAGFFSHEQWHQNIKPNKDSYATFAVVEHFVKEDNLYIPAGIRKQVGTFKDIINPFTAMTLKAVTALKLLQWQKAKKAQVQLMLQYFPNEIRELDHKMVFSRDIMAKKKEYDNGVRKKIEADKFNEGIITLMRDGKIFEYIVPWDVAQADKGVDPASMGGVWHYGNKSFRTVFYPLFITYNPGFQWLWSPIRDFDRSWTAMPNHASRMRLLKEYKRLWRESWGRMKGEVSPLIHEMMTVGAIGTPFDNYSKNLYEDPTSIFGMLLEKQRLVPTKPKGLSGKLEKGLRALSWPFSKILHIGQTFETLAKVAPYKILTRDLGVDPRDAGEFVRNHTGVPPYWKRGKVAYMSQALVPFINVAMKGYMMDARLAFGRREGLATNQRKRLLGLGPLSGGSGGGGRVPPRFPTDGDPTPWKGGRPRNNRGEKPSRKAVSFSWWSKYFRSNGLFTMLKGGAILGMFGSGLKKAFDMIPSYDKENYHCIPFGYCFVDSEGKDTFVSLGAEHIPMDAKVMYLRFPMDESSKLVAGVQHRLAMAAAQFFTDEDVAVGTSMPEFLLQQVPGLNPLIDISSTWVSYAKGINPRDEFHGGNVLSHDEHLARGEHGIKAMMKWTADETGITNFINYDPETDTSLEWNLKNLPIISGTIGKLIKVSDGGKYEKGYDLDAEMDKRYAKLKLTYGKNTLDMHKQWTRVAGVRKENRYEVVSEDEYAILSEWNKEYASLHSDAKSLQDYIDDPAVKTADKKKYEKYLQEIRDALEDLSTAYNQPMK